MNTLCCSHKNNQSSLNFFSKILLSIMLLLLMVRVVSAEPNQLGFSIALSNCGKGIELDGTNDLVNIPDLNLSSDFTVESWVKLAPGIDYKDGIFGNGSTVHLYFASGKARLYAFGVRVTANTAISAGSWAHIALTRSGTNLTLFVNGVEDGTGHWNGVFSIKSFGQGYRGYFKGMMDEVRIWNVARTGAEIGASYDATVDPNTLGLIGYWNFNDSDQIITDASSSENHASLGASTTVGTDDPVRLESTAPVIENCDGGNTGGNSNVAPVANDDTAGSIKVGGTLSIVVTDNDVDNDDNLDLGSVEIVSEPSSGTATVDNASGEITYISTGTIATNDTLTYTVKDTAGEISNEATVSITVTEPTTINIAPVANDDTVDPVEIGGTTTFTVTDNDVDSNGNLNTTSVVIVTEPSEGMATVNDVSGIITYLNTGTLATTDTLTYKVADTEGVFSNEATVSIAVIEPTLNNQPVAETDIATVQTGEAVTIDVLINDNDNDGTLDKNSLVVVSTPISGAVDIDFNTGEIIYTHDGSATTSDSFTYTIEDNDGAVSNEATVSIIITHSASAGSCGKGIELDGINDFVNIPDLTLGSDFTVEAWVKLAPGIDYKDGLFGNGSNMHLYFVSGKARLYAFGVRVTANTVISADTWAHIALTRSGTNLTLFVNGVEDGIGHWNGTFSIKSLGQGYRGYFKGMMDEVRIWNVARTGAEIGANYDATVDLNAPGLIGYWNFNDSGQIITDASSSANYASLGASTAIGTDDPVRLDSIAPVIENCDGGNTGGNSNVAPVANDDTVDSVEIGRTTTFTVTGNDVDSDGNLNTASVVIVTLPSEGIATVDDESGIITYLNESTAATTDTLTYKVADTEGVFSNEATVSIAVTESTLNNQIPVAQADTATVQSDESVTIQILDNDSDDGTLDISSLNVVNAPNAGTVDIDFTTGEMTYTHDGSEVTSDSFTYTVADEQGAESEEATVSISITHLAASCGKGIELDGINDWVNIPDLTLADDFTIESWVKLAPVIDNKDALFGQEGSGSDINFYQGKVHLYANEDKIIANTALLSDTWGHVAITRLDDNLMLYINGIEDATGTWDEALSLKAIGRGNRGYFKGVIDEIRVWDIARTGAEISASYNTDVDPDSLGLIGYWTFNERDQIITDSSSSVNHGSLGASTAVGMDDPLRLDSIAPLTESCDEGNTRGNSNVPPIANNDTVGSVEAGATISFKVTDNDVDNDNNLDPTSVTIILAPTYGTAEVDAFGMITYTNTGTTAIIDTLYYTVADTEGAVSNLGTVLISVTGSSLDSRPIINIQSVIVDEFYNGNALGSWVVQQPATSDFSYLVTPEQITITGGLDNQHLTRLNTNIDPNLAYAMYSKFKINSGEGIQSYAMSFLQDNQPATDPINSWTLNLDLANGGVVKHLGFLNGSPRSIGSHAATWAQANTEYIYQVDVHRRKDGSFSPKWVTGKILDLQGTVLDHFEIDYSSFPWQPDLSETVGIGLNSHGADWEARDLIVWYTDNFVENNDPVANAGADQAVTDINDDGLEMVSLNGSLSNDLDGDSLTFSWSENSIILGADQNITHSFDVGVHIVTLTVDDGNGGMTSDDVAITINAGEPNVFDNVIMPPILINPTKIVLSRNSATINIAQYGDCGVGKVYSLNLADDEDALITFDGNSSLPYPVHIHGGKNLIIRGLDIVLETQPGNEIGTVTLSSQEYNQTNPHPVVPACSALRLNVKQQATHWVEGLYLDTKGHDADGIIINADDNSINSKVVIQNSLIKGIEGNYSSHGDALQTQSGHLTDIIFENVTMRQADEGIVFPFPVDNVEMRNIDYGTDTRFDSDDEWDDLVSGGFFAGTQVNAFSLDNIYIKYKNPANDLGFIIGDKHFTSPETAGEVVNGITTESHSEVHFKQLPLQGDYVLESQVGKNYNSLLN